MTSEPPNDHGVHHDREESDVEHVAAAAQQHESSPIPIVAGVDLSQFKRRAVALNSNHRKKARASKGRPLPIKEKEEAAFVLTRQQFEKFLRESWTYKRQTDNQRFSGDDKLSHGLVLLEDGRVWCTLCERLLHIRKLTGQHLSSRGHQKAWEQNRTQHGLAAPDQPDIFVVNQRVIIHSLVEKGEHNGSEATVLRTLNGGEKFIVEIIQEDPSIPATKLVVAAENLTPKNVVQMPQGTVVERKSDGLMGIVLGYSGNCVLVEPFGERRTEAIPEDEVTPIEQAK